MVGKIKDQSAGIVMKEFVRLKSKMCSFLLDDSSEHKKVKRCEWKCSCSNKS